MAATIIVLGIYMHLYDCRSDGGVVDNTIDYQSRDRKIDPPPHRFSGLSDETLNRGLSVLPRCWWDVKPSSLTHSLTI